MAELGQTDDPAELIPGSPASLEAAGLALRLRGDELTLAGRGLSRIDTAEGWSGPAADAFRSTFDGQPGKWLEAGDCFHVAADALRTYAKTLLWAQTEAATAVKQWTTAEPLRDLGADARAAAQERLANARTQVKAAGDRAATTAGAARDKAPKKPGFWSKAGDFAADVGADVQNTGAHALNGLASFGNAVTHHPGDVALAAAGAGLTLVGSAGNGGGLVLDATGVGAIAGVPINIASTATMALGGGMLAGALSDLTMHANTDDHVSPARTDHTGPSSGGTIARAVHGTDRTAMRGVDVDHVWKNGDMYVQSDGQIVKVLDNGNGTYDVVVRDMSSPSGSPTTVLKNATDKYVKNKVEGGQWE